MLPLEYPAGTQCAGGPALFLELLETAMARQQLKRVLGEGFAIAACVGGVIGLGIMRTPGEIAATITEPVTYMSLWIGGGLLELVALLVIVELIAREQFPAVLARPRVRCRMALRRALATQIG